MRQKTFLAIVLPEAVEAMLSVAERIRAEMEASRQASLFPVPTLAEKIIFDRKRSQTDDSPLSVSFRRMREESRIVTGMHEIYGSLHDEVGFIRVFRNCRVSREIMKDNGHGAFGQALQQTLVHRDA